MTDRAPARAVRIVDGSKVVPGAEEGAASDFPYLRRDLAVSCREHIQTSSELTESERAVLGAAAELLARRADLPDYESG